MSWYANWFDSEYYHQLYQHRNDAEAEIFLNNLALALPPFEGKTALDLCCGKGRHSRWMNAKGLEVTGFDLSPKSIEAAREMGPESIRYEVKDMRADLGTEAFDFVFNLFTSFGYFDDPEENALVLEQVYDALKPGGYFILDFLNPSGVLQSLQEKETVTRQNLTFEIDRFVDEENFLCKNIRWEINHQPMEFTERVYLFTPDDLEALCDGLFERLEIFGDYQLQPMDESKSLRQISIWKKIG
jgi:SAM-dependent methyltransferase